MEYTETLRVVERALDKSPVATFLTVDGDGRPRGRWMVPALIRGETGVLHALSSQSFAKIDQLRHDARATWLIDTRAELGLVEILGLATVDTTPGLLANVLEALGPRMSSFWRAKPSDDELVVIETTIEEVSWFSTEAGAHVSIRRAS